MANPNTVAVLLWGKQVGALFWDEARGVGLFEFDSAFQKLGLDLAPFTMPISSRAGTVFSFLNNRNNTFNGLPGLLADSLPDKFGNDILKVWLASRGLSTDTLNPAVRLSYVGNRGMGALEFRPAEHSSLLNRSVEISISEMSDLCESILRQKEALDVNLTPGDDGANREAMNDIIRISSSAGGAKAKAIIAMNEAGHVISGQVDVPEGYSHYLVKFDIAGNFDRDRNNGLPPASGRIEYAYYLMAKEAKIDMTPCRLLEIEGHGHFMTKRFDRTGNQKEHIQTLAALEHFDRDASHDYAQLAATARKLNLGMPAIHEIYRRMVFNALAYNRDDHTKNFAFKMRANGEWQLTPAFDVTYAFDPGGRWTSRHQMSLFGKNDGITFHHLQVSAEQMDITSRHASAIFEDVRQAVAKWRQFAQDAGLDDRSCGILEKLFEQQK